MKDNLSAGEPDPLAERECSPAPGVVRRYADRALVLATRNCFIECPFCTRLHFVRGAAPPCSTVKATHTDATGEQRELVVDTASAIEWIRTSTEVREVLVSGGDPLTMQDGDLDELLGQIRAIPHVELLRVATRAPMARPDRVTPELCGMLRARGPLVVTVHFNHPAELTAQAQAACARLVDAGVPLLNQAVLLAGVNDDSRVLAELMWRLARARVRPYYLLQCDRVAGTERFWVPLGRAMEIVGQLPALLPGHAIPVFVVDLPGWLGKARIDPGSPPSRSREGWTLRSPSGSDFLYREYP